VFLVIFITVQILISCSLDVPYRRNMRETYAKIFLFPEDNTDSIPVFPFYIYKVDEFFSVLNHSITTYFNLERLSVDRFSYVGEKTMYMVVTSFENVNDFWNRNRTDFNMKQVQTTYQLSSEHPLGPLENVTWQELRIFLNELVQLDISCDLYSQDLTSSIPVFYLWHLTFTFKFVQGRIDLSIQSDYTIEKAENEWLVLFTQRFLWLDLVIIFLCILSLVLSFKSIASSFLAYQRIRRKHASGIFVGGLIAWETLSLSKKLQFFNKWFLLSILGNIISIIGFGLNIIEKIGLLPGENMILTKLLIGIGAALSWINILRYMESFKQYYVLIIALRFGMPGVSRLVLSALPILVGYALLGMVIFSELTDHFSSFDHSFASLFSSINGDGLYSIYLPMADDYSALLTRLFQYSLVCLGAYAVINIFFAIIQEAYERSRKVAAETTSQEDSFFNQFLSSADESDINTNADVWKEMFHLRPSRRYESSEEDESSSPLLMTKEMENVELDKEDFTPLKALQARKDMDKKQRSPPLKGSSTERNLLGDLIPLLKQARKEVQLTEKRLYHLESLVNFMQTAEDSSTSKKSTFYQQRHPTNTQHTTTDDFELFDVQDHYMPHSEI